MERIFIYDFDGTLTPSSLPDVDVLRLCGINSGILNSRIFDRFKYCGARHNEKFCRLLYRVLFAVLKLSGIRLTDENLSKGADAIKLNPGVEEYLRDAQQKGIKNYMISAHMLVFLRRLSIAPLFEDMIGTTFTYSGDEVSGIEFLMHDDTKVTVIKGIILSNGYTDCSKVVYFGDGLTDVEAMRYVKENNGSVIFVRTDDNDHICRELASEGIVDRIVSKEFFMRKDYLNGEHIFDEKKDLPVDFYNNIFFNGDAPMNLNK